MLTNNTYVRVKQVFASFGEALIAEGIAMSYDIKDNAVVGRSGGVKYYDANGRVVLSMGVSVMGSPRLEFSLVDTGVVGRVYLTTVEQVLCDKISVLYSRSRFRRAKDLYDIWLVLTCCNTDTESLRQMLMAKDLYPLPTDKAPFRDDCINEMEHAYEKFVLIDPVTEQERDKPSFKEVMKVVGGFLVKFMRDDT